MRKGGDQDDLTQHAKHNTKRNPDEMEHLRFCRLRLWNVEGRPDGLYFCDGAHEPSQGCHWKKLTAEIWSRAVANDYG